MSNVKKLINQLSKSGEKSDCTLEEKVPSFIVALYVTINAALEALDMRSDDKSKVLIKKINGMIIRDIERIFALEVKDDAWISEHADELKKQLLERAQGGKPKPAKGTVLGRALELFTTEQSATD